MPAAAADPKSNFLSSMFGGGSSSSSSTSSEDEKPSPISRESRQACWNNRDAFFQCLNVQGIDIPPTSSSASGGEKKAGACEEAMKAYEGNCAKSWVDYFNKRRILEIRQRKTVEAAERDRERAASNAPATQRGGGV